jgi:hypothetical protein
MNDRSLAIIDRIDPLPIPAEGAVAERFVVAAQPVDSAKHGDDAGLEHASGKQLRSGCQGPFRNLRYAWAKMSSPCLPRPAGASASSQDWPEYLLSNPAVHAISPNISDKTLFRCSPDPSHVSGGSEAGQIAQNI